MDLRGKRVLITRPSRQAGDFADLLRGYGAIPVIFPTIRISPGEETPALDRALQELDQYDWLVVTSVNGVRAMWERLDNLGIARLPASLKVAAIGPKTASAMQEKGVGCDFIPEEYVAEAILPGLGDVRGKRVLLLRADIARQALPQAIVQAGGTSEEIAVYRTVPAQINPEALRALRQGVDILTFTSSSTVRSFIEITREAGLEPQALPGKPLIACIGPVTAQTALEEGLVVHLVAKEYTTAGLVKALIEYSPEEVIP
jgi:uroporphyrinogen-III synthase